MELQKTINDLRQKINDMRSEMEGHRLSFLRETADFVKTWYRDRVRQASEERHDVTKRLGVNGVRVLKRNLEEIIERVPAAVKEHVGPDKLWSHTDAGGQPLGDEWRYSDPSRARTTDVGNAVRTVLYRIGEFLADNGFISGADGDLDWGTPRSEGAFRYKRSFDWSAGMLTSINAYSKLHSTLCRSHRDVEVAEGEKAKAEARSIWNEA